MIHGIFVAISVFFGTILVHKYEFEIENNDNQYIKTCVNVNNNERENIKNIIINEIDIGGSKGILLSIYQFLVGIFVAISVFFWNYFSS